MGLSNKIIPRALIGNYWEGRISLVLQNVDGDMGPTPSNPGDPDDPFSIDFYTYTRHYMHEGSGSLEPLLETVKKDMKIYSVMMAHGGMGWEVFVISFYTDPEPTTPKNKEFVGLKTLILHSERDGESLVIRDIGTKYDNEKYIVDGSEFERWAKYNLRGRRDKVELTIGLEW